MSLRPLLAVMLAVSGSAFATHAAEKATKVT
jgi:hypothetical protein